MNRHFVLILAVLFFPVLASAQSVVSYTVSPTSINSGSFVDFVWDLQDAGGYSFRVPCSPGVKFKKTDGSTFACDTGIISTVKTDDFVSLYIHNVSGGTKTIVGRLIPKDAGGQDQESAAREVTVSVATNPQPIANFSVSATSTTIGQAVTASWSSSVLDGVNLQIECRDEIKVSSPSYPSAYMPCGQPIFTNDLSPNSSLALTFTNSNFARTLYKLTLLPAISANSYDGTHAAYFTLDVASDVLPDPEVTLFSASSTVGSGEEVKITWATEKSKGANIKISCNSAVSATSSKISNTLPCDTLAFSESISPAGQLSLWFANKGTAQESLVLTLLPSKKLGEYDSARAKTITLFVRPKGAAVLPPPLPPPPVSPPPAPSTLPSPPVKKAIFTIFLSRGSRGAQVSALQEFLKRGTALYPEGLVTGFFGFATERAVQRFQGKYGIADKGVAGYGMVGPKTRAKLNTLP